MHVTHSFGAWFDDQSRVLILGTMPSPKSREAGFYYAHPQNRFWRVLRCCTGNRRLLGTFPSKKNFSRGITLRCGMCWTAVRSKAHPMRPFAIQFPIACARILDRAPIEAIFCTGQKAGTLFKRYCQKDCAIQARVLPSTSPANCAVKLEQLLERYAVIRQITDRRKQTKP